MPPDPETVADALLATSTTPRRPSATYRLQMHHAFRFDDATAIVDYLAALGISDVYLSPYLAARPGSTHGYDVFDHNRINPEIGDEAAHDRFLARLAGRAMGRVLDVVPNHMGVGDRNKFWLDVLEVGPSAPSARFFDIDWHPIKEELENQVLLPILGDQYGRVLENGEFELQRDGGAFFIHYHETKLPLSPRSYALVLERRAEALSALFPFDDPRISEYRSIWASAYQLPPRNTSSPEEVEARLRERDVIKRRLGRLVDESPEIAAFIDANIAEFAGTPGEPRTFDPMDRLLSEQVYRLAYWRVAAEEINYRRFFDINDLAGLRVEDPTVFDVAHALILRWVEQGGVTGLRIDHPDGLADPLGYFRRLQESLFLVDARRRLETEHPGADWREVVEPLRKKYREQAEADPESHLARRFPVVAEKILSRGEELPDDWPIDGTVGYEYLNALNGLFIDSEAASAVESAYAEFTGDREPFADVLYHAKGYILRFALASEVNALGRWLDRVSERDRRSRDFTLNELRVVIREVIAAFPVYRTYILPGRPIAARDRGYVEQAVARARRRNPTIDKTLFEFVKDALLFELAEPASGRDTSLNESFVRRFQQTTGPIQAKGLEDTAFYRQVKLASANEVGADPQRFGNSASVFHALNAQRLNRWPGALGTTATHDTKRGEDARIRIDALSELAEDWRVHLARWSRANARRKTAVNDQAAPDAREEYLLYQNLIGSWPFEGGDSVPEGFVGRLQQYMLKAIREAKLNTTWTDPDSSYSDAVTKFVADVLEGPDAGVFLADFLPFQRRIARIGVVHSLAQTLLKLASPGVPDVYQGCELWDFSLVDPDNRRPVDYEGRRKLLDQIRSRLDSGTSRSDLARALYEHPEDGAVKLYIVSTVLNHRLSDPALYAQGTYRPIESEGDLRSHVVSFARSREGRSILVVAPRLVTRLMGDDSTQPPVGPSVWGSTRLILPEGSISHRCRDLLTDRVFQIKPGDAGATLDLGEVLGVLPVALLVDEGR